MKILSALFLLTIAVLPAAGGAEKKNVLFLICDDLNCDMGVYGHPLVQTPNLDRLAARGLRFDNAHCQYPLCGPSRASLMTGLYPNQTLITDNRIYLREHLPQVTTLSQLFREQGYRAIRIGKIYHYDVPGHLGTAGHDDPDSWEETFNFRGRDKEDEDLDLIFTLKKGAYGATLSWLAAEGEDAEQTDGLGALEAVRQLERHQQSGEPFFLAVGLFRPHTPYVAPQKYFDLYPLDAIRVPEVPEGYESTLPAPAAATLHRWKDQDDLDPEIARRAIQAYYASISFADAQVGVVLDALDRTGLADETIVVFTSDHGYHMGEHGTYQKLTLFENATRVPLIIALPGEKPAAPATVMPAELVDVYRTVADAAGYSVPGQVQGVSLLPTYRDASARPREDALSQIGQSHSLRTERFRYTDWGSGGRELYDHQIDPAEMRNLAEVPEHAERVAELSARLRERVAAAQARPEGLVQVRIRREIVGD